MMTTKEQEDASTVDSLKDYFKKIMGIIDRWMKVMTNEEGDFASSMIIDQVMKCLIIKLDRIYGIKDRIVEKEFKFCKTSIKDVKEICKRKLDLQLKQF